MAPGRDGDPFLKNFTSDPPALSLLLRSNHSITETPIIDDKFLCFSNVFKPFSFVALVQMALFKNFFQDNAFCFIRSRKVVLFMICRFEKRSFSKVAYSKVGFIFYLITNH